MRENFNPVEAYEALTRVCQDNNTQGAIFLIKKLIKREGTLNNHTQRGQNTPLHWAVLNNNTTLVEELLPKRAELTSAQAAINTNNADGMTPIQLAVACQHWESVIAIAKRVSQQSYTYELWSTDRGRYGKALLSAARSNRTEAALALAKASQSWYDKFGNFALHWAASNNNPEIVRALLPANSTQFVDPRAALNKTNTDGKTPIVLAAESEAWESVIAIAERVKQCTSSWTIYEQDRGHYGAALLCAVRANHTKAALALIRADKTCSDEDNNTALHWAANNNNQTLINALLKQNASFEARNRAGKTPLELGHRNQWIITLQMVLFAEDSSILARQLRSNKPAMQIIYGFLGQTYQEAERTRQRTQQIVSDMRSRADHQLRGLTSGMEEMIGAAQTDTDKTVAALFRQVCDSKEETIYKKIKLLQSASGHYTKIKELLANIALSNGQSSSAQHTLAYFNRQTQSIIDAELSAIDKVNKLRVLVDRLNRLKDFHVQLDGIAAQAQSLRERGFASAADSADQLVLNLQQRAQDYLVAPERIRAGVDYAGKQFKDMCLVDIHKAEPTLEQHRGWKRALGNLLLAILGVGVFYAIAVIIHANRNLLDRQRTQKLGGTRDLENSILGLVSMLLANWNALFLLTTKTLIVSSKQWLVVLLKDQKVDNLIRFTHPP